MNVVLLPSRWEEDVVPTYRGDDPQQIINEQMVNKCDILVGVFWTKLGSQQLITHLVHLKKLIFLLNKVRK